MKTPNLKLKPIALAVCASAVLAGCGSSDNDQQAGPDLNALPAAITNLAAVKSYDGNTDDLLTAGLGKTGLASAAPTFADPANPTPAELRRRAIHANYRGIVDITAAGGYGTLYGPNVSADGVVTNQEGKIAGKEYMAYADDGSGKKNVTMLVQIPATFDKNNPCIITAPSSGSRGVYGAIGSAGEWGLKRG